MKHFITERELVLAFNNYLYQTIVSPSIKLFNEFETTNGIADLVLAYIPNRSKDLSSIGQINPRWVAALAAVEDKTMLDIGYFSHTSGLSIRESNSAFKYFNVAGYISRIGSDTYKKTNLLQPIISELCAIEAKLRDWKKALYQAYRYQDFAHKSWVLLDANNVNPALENICEFNKFNVGLASIDINQQVRIYFAPKFSEPRFQQAFWNANCVVSRNLTDFNVPNKIYQSHSARVLNVPDSRVFQSAGM